MNSKNNNHILYEENPMLKTKRNAAIRYEKSPINNYARTNSNRTSSTNTNSTRINSTSSNQNNGNFTHNNLGSSNGNNKQSRLNYTASPNSYGESLRRAFGMKDSANTHKKIRLNAKKEITTNNLKFTDNTFAEKARRATWGNTWANREKSKRLIQNPDLLKQTRNKINEMKRKNANQLSNNNQMNELIQLEENTRMGREKRRPNAKPLTPNQTKELQEIYNQNTQNLEKVRREREEEEMVRGKRRPNSKPLTLNQTKELQEIYNQNMQNLENLKEIFINANLNINAYNSENVNRAINNLKAKITISDNQINKIRELLEKR